MFATILATPCSGPLLGATLAWTLTQSAQVVFTVFASIGVGMAFPYVLFASSSSLSRLVPKPGIWMKDYKYLMGFVLIGMAVYLMKGLPQDMIVSTIGLCVSLAFAVIVYTRFAPWGASIRRKVTMIIISMVSLGCSLSDFRCLL
jgi:thiol:disulfide interchange protein DsbD